MPEFKDADNVIELLDDKARPMSKSERTRLKIMASAARVFDEKGFDEASIQDIANDAGVAKGTIYYYVDKKEDLLLMLVRFGQARLFSKIEKGTKRADTASEKIEIMIRNHLKIVKTVGPVAPFFAQNILSNDSRVKDVVAGLRERYLHLLGSFIEEGIKSGEFRQIDSRKAAVAILGMVIGQLIQYKVFVGKINAREITKNTVDIALNGLRRPHEE